MFTWGRALLALASLMTSPVTGLNFQKSNDRYLKVYLFLFIFIMFMQTVLYLVLILTFGVFRCLNNVVLVTKDVSLRLTT